MAKPSRRRRRYPSQSPTFHRLTNHQKGEHNRILQQLLIFFGRDEPPEDESVEDRDRVPRRHRGGN